MTKICRESQLQHLIALTLVDGIGPVTCRNLISFLGGAEEVLTEKRSKLEKIKGIGPVMSQKLSSVKNMRKAEEIIEYCLRHDVEILKCSDSKYPHELRAIHDAPLLLYKKGEMKFNEQPAIGIVGTRKPSEYGRKVAWKLGHFFAETGFSVVSGLAYGIDREAHLGAMAANGSTMAVLGHGIDRIYPGSHRRIADEMLERGGWVTEFFPGSKPEAGNFPARNRIIAGLSRALIVVEARKKGGALITARQAFDQDRLVYAVPGQLGNVASVGCNQLIRDQIAKLLYSPEEVLSDLEIELNYGRWKTDQAVLEKPVSGVEGVERGQVVRGGGPSAKATEEMDVLMKGDGVNLLEGNVNESTLNESLASVLQRELEGAGNQRPGNSLY